MNNSRTSDRQKLQRISNIARSIRSLCNAPDSDQHSIDDVPLPPQLIPSATPISPQLEEIGLSSRLAGEVSTAYLKSCCELRSICESSLRKAIAASQGSVMTETVQDVIRIWSVAHSQQTNLWAEAAFFRAREWVAKTRNISQPKKPSFNHEYTPLLEKYFEYNAYPSAPDRAVLARKSMMTPRQIEVWFQNHRNRAKKEGRTLCKLSADRLPLVLSLQSLEQTMPFFTVPEDERKPAIESDVSESEASDEEDTDINPKYSLSASTGGDLDIAAPPHAFPTPYPPSCHYVSFSYKSGKPMLPAPVWARKPATSLRARAIGDFDDFVADFSAKLQLTESPSNNGRRRNHSPSANKLQPWFTATHTYALPAPHPAFIRSSIQVMPSRSSAIPVVSAPPSRLHPFRSPSPSSTPASLMPSSQTTTAVRRKVARLPKRSPNRQSMAHRGVSPATSEASLSPSSRSCSLTSCASSFNLDSTTQRRPSSSSSSSSSSTLTTPELSPAMLPYHAQSPVSVAGIDFQELDGLFGDPLNTSSPNEGLQLSFPTEHSFNVLAFTEKQLFRFGIEVPSLDQAREHS